MVRLFPTSQFGWLIFGPLLLLALLIGAVLSADTKPPPVHWGDSRRAWVEGNVVTVEATGSRDSRACSGGHADRRLVSFSDDPADTKIDDLQPIMEHDMIAWDDQPVHHEHPHWHLYGPLVGNPQQYFVQTRIIDNCPLWYRALPERLKVYFREKPSFSPTTRISPGAPPATTATSVIEGQKTGF